MKSILKTSLKSYSKQKGSSQSTLVKIPLRVTFVIDKDTAHKHLMNNKPTKSIIQYDGDIMTQGQQSTEESNQNLEINSETKRSQLISNKDLHINIDQSGSWVQNEFKRENTEWNNFILVYNPKSLAECFYCGKCHKDFQRIIEFVYHCLSECGQICHLESSHFIFDIQDWRSFLAKQIKLKEKVEVKIEQRLKGLIEPQSQDDVSNNDSHQQEKLLLPSSSPQSQCKTQSQQNLTNEIMCPSQDERKQTVQEQLAVMSAIHEFSASITNFWLESNVKVTFISNQHYLTLFGMVLLLNPQQQNYQNLYIRQFSKCPKIKYNSSMNISFLLNIHLQDRCCKINQLNSRYFILSFKQFYRYLYESKNYNLQDKQIDLGLLVYLFDNTSLQKQIDSLYPKVKYYRIFIKIMYHMFQGLMLSCSKCNYKELAHKVNKRALVKVQEHRTHFTLVYRTSFFERKIKIHQYEQYLKDETIYCPCNSFEKGMTFNEFIRHLNEEHSQSPLRIRIANSLN